ncbi:hypothetical protein [Nocardia carnea]|uniref:hypothetical protein n=1 Tax=Nocardia carnea TaxID=37328 RepID=UPI002458E37D|nr:hypothetical protein [Nocardia carnea]
MNRSAPTTSNIRTTQSVHHAAEVARSQLTFAFGLPLGPRREQHITEAVLDLITAEIGARNPAVATVLLDWEPYGGLGVAEFRDRHDNPVSDHDLARDITFYTSDIRAVADTPITPSQTHEPGLFRLDLTTANATTRCDRTAEPSGTTSHTSDTAPQPTSLDHPTSGNDIEGESHGRR